MTNSDYRITTNGVYFRIEQWRRMPWWVGPYGWHPLSYLTCYVETPAGVICSYSNVRADVEEELAKLQSLQRWRPVAAATHGDPR